MLVSATVSSVYYDLYKKQIIGNKIVALDAHLQNLLLRTEYELDYVKSYLIQKIESKEAHLVFNAKQGGNKLSAPDITEFLNLFVDQENSANNNSNIINDFIVFDTLRFK